MPLLDNLRLPNPNLLHTIRPEAYLAILSLGGARLLRKSLSFLLRDGSHLYILDCAYFPKKRLLFRIENVEL